MTVEPANTTQSVAQAALINALNPNPWLFWSAVGGPLLLAAWQVAPIAAALFILGFYGMLVG